MEIIRRVHGMREATRRARGAGRRIGFVPTMGALHDGHASLVRAVGERTDLTVVSVFVNPTQFGPAEDFTRYPRDLTRDADLCIGLGVDYLFAPENEEIYPPGASTFVEVKGLSDCLEGASRPGHFRGVATVVLKLLEIVGPHVAAFGQKDAQQAIVLRRMVRDLHVDVEFLVCPTVRDVDGLALSSRNAYLSPDERRAAMAIPRALDAAARAIASGERDPARVVEAARLVLEAEPLLEIDYVDLARTSDLVPAAAVEGEMLLAVAVRAGKTRLIDNVVLRA
jgi:pantoate--beta-alanine ligase